MSEAVPGRYDDEWIEMMRATDPPVAEAPNLYVYLVVWGGGGIGWAGTDRDRAHEYARNTQGVVARLPVVGDYREQPSDAGTVTP